MQRLNAPDLNREAEDRRVSRRELESGLVKIEAVLRADEAALLWKAIEQATAGVSAETRAKVDGLMAMVQSCLRGERAERSPVELVVTVPQASLRATSDDPAAVGDGFVSAETSRRLACDAGVVTAIESDAGEVLSVGRKTRTIPAAIKRALLVRDEGTCRFPGCSNRRFLDGHHVEHWANGGETRLENLVSLCSYHHGFVHEYGYRVELDADQVPTFYDPAGRIVRAVPERARPRPAWSVEDLAPRPPYLPCRWDGRPPDYSLAIDALLSVT